MDNAQIHKHSGLHLPGHNYIGPGTDVVSRIQHGHKPVDLDDYAALQHDIAYEKATTKQQLDTADDQFQNTLKWNSLHNVLGKIGIYGRKALQLDMRGNNPQSNVQSPWSLNELEIDWRNDIKKKNFKRGLG